MFLSVFDIFKIGIGPSSSHTMGPMIAANRFLEIVRERQNPEPGTGEPARLTCRLYGSLAWTGKGHATDRAVILGLAGFDPSTVDPDQAERAIVALSKSKTLVLADLPELAFDPESDLIYDYGPPLPGHANGMLFQCLDASGQLRHEETYYSIGGGFVVSKAEHESDLGNNEATDALLATVPFPFRNATEMLAMGEDNGLSIADLKRANETVHISSSPTESLYHTGFYLSVALSFCFGIDVAGGDDDGKSWRKSGSIGKVHGGPERGCRTCRAR